MKRRIRIREYANCINIEIGARREPVKTALAVLLAAAVSAAFPLMRQYALLLPWAVVETGALYLALWMFLEKTTISVFPTYVMKLRNYFFADIAGRFFQRDSISGMRKGDGSRRILFDYMGRTEVLADGLSPEEASYIMKFLVFSLGKEEFRKK